MHGQGALMAVTVRAFRAATPLRDTLPNMQVTGFDLVVIATWVLALARVTRLINVDEISDPLRIAIVRRWGSESMQAYFMQCPWCVSIWVGFATVAFPIWLTDLTWWMVPLLALGASQLTGLIAQLDQTEVEIDVEEE
jgi:hypothetical protein